MKYSIKTGGLVLLLAFVFSCNNGNSAPDSVPGNSDSISKDNTKIVVDTTHAPTHAMAVVMPEQDFINYAVPKNTKEIMWLKAGLVKGDAAIKAHSKMMLKDHNNLAEAIKNWMSNNKNITMPAVDTAGEVNINNKIGNDWNSAWIDKAVKDHNEILSNLKNAQTVVKDSSLNKIISNTIPIVESHLAMSKKMQDMQPK